MGEKQRKEVEVVVEEGNGNDESHKTYKWQKRKIAKRIEEINKKPINKF